MYTNINLTIDRFLRISTHKGGPGVIQTTASSGVRVAQDGSGYITEEFIPHQDFFVRLESSNVGRVTQKLIGEQHARHITYEKLAEYVSMAKEFYNLSRDEGGTAISSYAGSAA